jgi:hypothetical protein
MLPDLHSYGTPSAIFMGKFLKEGGKTARPHQCKSKWRHDMKKLGVWLGILILMGSMAVPAFAAQRQPCCVEQEKTETFQMRSQQEPLPWEAPGGKMLGRTATSLAE